MLTQYVKATRPAHSAISKLPSVTTRRTRISTTTVVRVRTFSSSFQTYQRTDPPL